VQLLGGFTRSRQAAIQCIFYPPLILPQRLLQVAQVASSILVINFQTLGHQSIVLLDEFFNTLLRLLQSLLTGSGQLYAALKRLQGLFQALFTALHLLDEPLELRECGLEVMGGG
jgi:hypothetical protein